MDIQQALQAMRNLGVTLNDYDTEALSTLCDFVEDSLQAPQASGCPLSPGVHEGAPTTSETRP
jgi:hypothetical protein